MKKISELKDEIVADFQTEFGGFKSFLKRSIIQVFAVVLAGLVWTLQKRIQKVADGIFSDTASGADLDLIGNRLNLARKTPTETKATVAVQASKSVTIQAGTIFVSISGEEYYTTETTDLTAGKSSLNITSKSTGQKSTLLTNSQLRAKYAIDGVEVLPEITITQEGVDGEQDKEYRLRVIDREKRRPQGGSYNDYVFWAEETPGVTRAWAYTSGGSTVEVYAVKDNETDILLSSSDIEAVKKNISKTDRLPMGSLIAVKNVLIKKVKVIITGYTGTETSKTALEIDLKRYFSQREMLPDFYLESQEGLNKITGITVTGIVSRHAGGGDVTLEMGGSNFTSYTLEKGELSQLESISYV